MSDLLLGRSAVLSDCGLMLSYETPLIEWSGIWLLLLCALGSRPVNQATSWRAHAIFYMDEVGREGSDAKKYRREVVYPEYRP